MITKIRASNNRTMFLSGNDESIYRPLLLRVSEVTDDNICDRTIRGDYVEVFKKLTKKFIDLLILDPPYNMNKKFGTNKFTKVSVEDYTNWLRNLFTIIKPNLKDTATIYICGDWFSSVSIFTAASEFFIVRNRITWEREKGRGAKTNWKNSSEDIWFCTMSDNYTFNVDDVKVRRKVLAPYRNDGQPKDWNETEQGNFRDTFPSNLWTDITIPFWSMSENTDHPTQKSEKLIAKLILASSNVGDFVFDPFLGSGTTSVVAKKLNRVYCGIEIDEDFAILVEKRLAFTANHDLIQGYADKVFWERNSSPIVVS